MFEAGGLHTLQYGQVLAAVLWDIKGVLDIYFAEKWLKV